MRQSKAHTRTKKAKNYAGTIFELVATWTSFVVKYGDESNNNVRHPTFMRKKLEITFIKRCFIRPNAALHMKSLQIRFA